MIRDYTPKDFDEVLRIFDENVPQYFALDERADLIHYLNNGLDEYHLVELDGEIVAAGGINYFVDSLDSARLSWDFVSVEYHGKGIGGKLIQFQIDRLKKNSKIKQIIVRTSQHAYGFYQKNGFQLEKIEKDYWAEGFDLYLMEINNW